MTKDATLLDEILDVLTRCEMTRSRFGKAVANDTALVWKLERGRRIGRRLEHRVRCGMAALEDRHRQRIESAYAALQDNRED